MRRADMYGSAFIGNTELDQRIERALSDLFDFQCSVFGDNYFARPSWIQVTTGTDTTVAWPRFSLERRDNGYPTSYPLPIGFRRLIRAMFTPGTVTDLGTSFQLSTATERMYAMRAMDLQGRTIDFEPTDWTQASVQYRIRKVPIPYWTQPYDPEHPGALPAYWHDPVIEFLPVPAADYAVQIWAVVLPDPWLEATGEGEDEDDDTLQVDYPEYIIAKVAAYCLEKQRSDSSSCRSEQVEIEASITNAARTVDAANAPMVVDCYAGPDGGDDYP